MRWFALANLFLPILAVAYPPSAPLIPFIQNGIFQAQQLHGDTNNAAKKQLVIDAVSAVSATGKVNIDPAVAAQVTNSVFSTIDAIHGVINSNKAPVPVA